MTSFEYKVNHFVAKIRLSLAQIVGHSYSQQALTHATKIVPSFAFKSIKCRSIANPKGSYRPVANNGGLF